VAGALARAGEDVMVVGREQTVEHIASHGVSVRSEVLGEFVARPRASALLTGEADVLVVATKATGLEAALGRVDTRPGLIVPLLNGFEHLALLRDCFGEQRVAAGVIRIDSERSRPGEVVQSGELVRVDLATHVPQLRDPLADFAGRLERSGVPVRIDQREPDVIWSKLVRLNALACTTTAADATIETVRSDPEWRATLFGCVYETAAVAVAEGAAIDPADTLAELVSAHPGLSSSLRRDVAAGRPAELDAIAGAVLRAAARHGLECPTVARLVARIEERIGREAERAAQPEGRA
jgi:2-dehydropantoate 2-reductase